MKVGTFVCKSEEIREVLGTGLCSNDRYGGQRPVESQRTQKFSEACGIENSIALEAWSVC